MRKSFQLTEGQRCTITNGLRVAAEKFVQNSMELRVGDYRSAPGGGISVHNPDRAEAIEWLAQQFDKQTEESRELARLIDDCESLEVTVDDES